MEGKAIVNMLDWLRCSGGLTKQSYPVLIVESIRGSLDPHNTIHCSQLGATDTKLVKHLPFFNTYPEFVCIGFEVANIAILLPYKT